MRRVWLAASIREVWRPGVLGRSGRCRSMLGACVRCLSVLGLCARRWSFSLFGRPCFGRSLLRLSLLALLSGILLAGCGAGQVENTPEAEPEQKVLNVWHQWGSGMKSEEFIQEAAALFEKEHEDVKIQIHALSTKTYTIKLSMDFLGTAENVDVFYYQVPSMMKQLVGADKLLPLNEYLPRETLEKIKEGRLTDTTDDGKIYGLPLYSSVFVLYCNRTLFEQAKVSLPTTYEELLAAGEALSGRGVTPLAVGAQEPWLAGGLYESMAITKVGAETMTKVVNGEASMSEIPEFREAAEQMNALFEAGFFGETPLNMTEFDAMDSFLDGNAAMFLDGTWASEYIDASGMAPDEIAVIGFPPSGDSLYAGNYVGSMTSGSFLVNKNTEFPAEAAEFAIDLSEYLGTRVYESGAGLACWEADASNITPTLKKVAALWDGVDRYVPAWDTVLPKEQAQRHLSECQGLLLHEPDFDGFLEAHEEMRAGKYR